MPSFSAHLEKARAEVVAGRLEPALSEFTAALRIITPDDTELEFAMSLAPGAKVVSTSSDKKADAIDSSIRAELVDILRRLRRFPEALHHAEIALYLDRFLGKPNDISASLHDVALINIEVGQLETARPYFKESADLDLGLLSRGVQSQVAHRSLVRAAILAEYGFLEESVRASEDLLGRYDVPTLGPARYANALNSAAQCLQNLGEHARAIEYFERGIRELSALSASHSELARLYRNLSLVFLERRDYVRCDECLRWCRDAPLGQVDRRLSTELTLTVARYKRSHAAWISRSVEESHRDSRSHDVFVSYNTRDQSVVSELVAELADLGLSVWTFQQHEGWASPRSFENVIAEMSREIDASRLVVIVASDTSVTSEYVSAEIEHAFGQGAPVLVWYPHGVRLSPASASTRTSLTSDHVQSVRRRLTDLGVFAIYGYGMRERVSRVPALGILKWFVALCPEHALSNREDVKQAIASAIDVTRLIPTVVEGPEDALSWLETGVELVRRWGRAMRRV